MAGFINADKVPFVVHSQVLWGLQLEARGRTEVVLTLERENSRSPSWEKAQQQHEVWNILSAWVASTRTYQSSLTTCRFPCDGEGFSGFQFFQNQFCLCVANFFFLEKPNRHKSPSMLPCQCLMSSHFQRILLLLNSVVKIKNPNIV